MLISRNQSSPRTAKKLISVEALMHQFLESLPSVLSFLANRSIISLSNQKQLPHGYDQPEVVDIAYAELCHCASRTRAIPENGMAETIA